jgi:hypothetical protein
MKPWPILAKSDIRGTLGLAITREPDDNLKRLSPSRLEQNNHYSYARRTTLLVDEHAEVSATNVPLWLWSDPPKRTNSIERELD